mmetsp:Transcript_33957/g.48236  ORF Transcript_33957/g.48236 Transcript_33957/m.48236 type:complete len:102 (+) Transcript_33957:137-442(+)
MLCFLFDELGVLNGFRDGVIEFPDIEPVGEGADLDVSGVTLGAFGPTALFWSPTLDLSGVGRFGEFSVEDNSEPVETKLFISERAGANIPGSLEVNALTAG